MPALLLRCPPRRRRVPARACATQDADETPAGVGGASEPSHGDERRMAPEGRTVHELLILIVDDDAMMTDLLPRKLRRAIEAPRPRILTAATPEEGIRLAAEARPHVVLSDYNLRASLTGLDVLEEVRRAVPEAGRVLFTGHARHEVGPHLADAPIHAFVEKPMRLDELVGSLVQAIRDATGIEVVDAGGSGR